MKLSASQSRVQSDDAVNMHPSWAELSYLSCAESPTSSTRCSCCELLAGFIPCNTSGLGWRGSGLPCNTSGPSWRGSGQAAPSGRYRGASGGGRLGVEGRGRLPVIMQRQVLQSFGVEPQLQFIDRVDGVRDGVLLVLPSVVHREWYPQ